MKHNMHFLHLSTGFDATILKIWTEIKKALCWFTFHGVYKNVSPKINQYHLILKAAFYFT
jgi:hypothetical protein